MLQGQDCKSRNLSVHHRTQTSTHGELAVLTQTATKQQPAINAHQEHSPASLASAIAESINASHLALPEPPVFSGDPLRYNDWQMSFETLIGRKNIPMNIPLHSPAKKAFDSFFLIVTDAVYHGQVNYRKVKICANK